jgi:CelD/BcsL family acetyltransferase involved in cellulose biosynthesis
MRPDARLLGQAPAANASVSRAVAAERDSPLSVTVEVRQLACLGNIAESWQALAACALEQNVFLEPAFALAAAPVLGSGVQVVLIWSQSAPAELLGLFPVRIESWRYGLPLPVLCSWTHPFFMFGAPLVHRDAAELAVSAWLDHIAEDSALPAFLLMPYIRDDSAFAALLNAVSARRGYLTESYGRHRRALLAPKGDRSHYIDQAIARRRRKELGRQWRRMQDLGPTAVLHADRPAEVAAALADFFRMEASGWKGRVGTAVTGDPRLCHFMTSVVTGLAARGQATIHRLAVGDKAVAACITLRSGDGAWCWKIAYDEDYARFSPGAQLLVRVTVDLLSDATIVSADSLAAPDHPLIDHIWRERCTMSDRLIAVRANSLVAFSVVRRLEAMRRLVRAVGRTLRDHWRGR